jgi:hypothetical protein
MKTASRTLVKSPPELWDLLDHHGRMQGLMCALLGHATEVTVDEREPESVLRWQAAGEDAWIEVELAEKGWGTHVEVSAERPSEPTQLEGWLDAVLDELATPQRRPFEGMREDDGPPAPAEIVPVGEALPEAPPSEEPVEDEPDEEPVEDEPSEQPETEPPAAEAPAPEPDEPKRKKRRRFFGF